MRLDLMNIDIYEVEDHRNNGHLNRRLLLTLEPEIEKFQAYGAKSYLSNG